MYIVYFPYLSMGKVPKIRIGNQVVWNFDLQRHNFIKDQPVLERTEKLFSAYKAHKRPLEGIGVLRVSSNESLTPKTSVIKQAREVQLILFITMLARWNTTSTTNSNAAHYVVSSENFALRINTFQLSSDYVAEQDGGIVNVLIGGYRISDLHYESPLYVLSPSLFGPDVDLLDQLLWCKRNAQGLYARILRATDLFFQGYHNDPNVSDQARIILLSSAFEALLDIPEQQQRKHFKDQIERLTTRATDRQYSYTFQIPDRSGTPKDKTDKRPMQVVWAERFYTLRNQIAHGKSTTNKEYRFGTRQRHVDLSVMFFALCLKRLLNDALGYEYFHDEIVWGRESDPLSNKSYGAFVYSRNELKTHFHKVWRQMQLFRNSAPGQR